MRLAPYVVATALGEALGQVASAIIAELVTGYVSTAPETATTLLPLSLVLAGLLEGLAVGGAQAYVLRAHVPAARFVAATTLAMTLSWAACALVSLVEPANVQSTTFFLGVGGVLGLIVGTGLGLAQGRVLERAGIKSTRFISYSALAWCTAQLALVMLAPLSDDSFSLKHIALRGLVGVIGGAIAGLIAGPALVEATEVRVRPGA